MADTNNPYSSPPSGNSGVLSLRINRNRSLAIVLFALPVVLAVPAYYFVFNYSTSVMRPISGPDHRAGFLSLVYLCVMFCVTVYTMLPACLLLRRSHKLSAFTNAITFLPYVLLAPAIWISVWIYMFYFPLQD